MRVALVLLLVAAPAVFGQSRSPVAPAGWVATTDLEYARVGELALRLDIVHPAAPVGAPLPVVVFIHGGGWRSGTKERGYSRLAPIVATRRYIGVTIDYRLAPDSTWPAQIHDCKAAVRWLRAHAARFGIDPTRVAAWGPSAGGHLAAMLGTSGGDPALEGALGNAGESSAIQAAIDFSGPSDLRTAAGTRGAFAGLLGAAEEGFAERARSASPVACVHPGDPPFLIMHGEDDPTVPIAMGRALDAALRAAGVDVTFVALPGVGHGVFGEAVDAQVLAFLDRVIGDPTLAARDGLARELARAVADADGSRRDSVAALLERALQQPASPAPAGLAADLERVLQGAGAGSGPAR